MKVVFEEAEGAAVIRPINDQYFKAFRGMLISSEKLGEEIKAMKVDEKKLEDRKLNIHIKKK